MPEIEIICLANSRKRQGRCIAGLRTDGGGWVRPVAPCGDGSLFPQQYRLRDGAEPQVGDMLRIGVQSPLPKPHQPENWLIDGTRWELLARPLPGEKHALLQASVVAGPELFGNRSDRLPENSFHNPTEASLALVVPQNLRWRIFLTEDFRRRTRAVFSLGAAEYDLSLTDPVWEERLRHLPESFLEQEASNFPLPDSVLLTVSLSEPFNGFCYKLVAAVIVL
jgi:hypothetical protein